MRYHPRYIVFWAVSRYMTQDQIETFRIDIGKYHRGGVKSFIVALSKHVDLEILLRTQQIREDAWIYNYLMYDCKRGFVKSKLIRKYEKEVVLPVEEKFQELVQVLNK